MVINGTTSATYEPSLERTASGSKAALDDGADSSATPASDTVEISPEAAQLAAREQDGAAGEESGEQSAESAESSGEGADDAKPSTSKSFVYGALGLERPEYTENHKSDGYDVGRWLAAGVTIGTIISVLI